MLVGIALATSVACLILGLFLLFWRHSDQHHSWIRSSFLGNYFLMAKSRNSAHKVQPISTTVNEDRYLYERAIALVRENRVVDGSKLLEELGLNREAAAVLERAGMVQESAAVFLRRKRYHRAAEVYARHQMWQQAGSCYMLAAAAMREQLVKPSKPDGEAMSIVNAVDTALGSRES
jgi:hypothetical protein